MSRDWNASSVDWAASRKAGAFVMDAPTPPRRKRPADGKPIRRVLSRPYQASYYHSQARYCVLLLTQALEHARNAGAPYTVKRIEAALSSARGAVRNAGYRVTRAATEARR